MLRTNCRSITCWTAAPARQGDSWSTCWSSRTGRWTRPGADDDGPPLPEQWRAVVVEPATSVDHADEGRVGAPDLAGVQRGSWVTRRDVLVAAEVDADVTGPPDQVAGLGLGGGHLTAGAALCGGGARQRDAHLVVDVGGEAGAVEPGGGGPAVHVRRAHVPVGDLDHLGGHSGGVGGRRRGLARLALAALGTLGALGALRRLSGRRSALVAAGGLRAGALVGGLRFRLRLGLRLRLRGRRRSLGLHLHVGAQVPAHVRVHAAWGLGRYGALSGRVA